MADQHFHVTGNMPGYMSNDDDPAAFADFWSALEGLADYLTEQADDLYDRTGMFGTGPYDVEDIGGEAEALEAEGDRVHAVAAAIRDTLAGRDITQRDPEQINLGPDDRWPLSMARNGIVVHIDTDPTSSTHLGWNVHLDPCVEDCDLTDLDLED